MEINISESPEKWVILKLPNKTYKVFGTWAGSYLDEDRWKLNSGIDKVEKDIDYYYFIGFSGSCYKCHKKSYGTASTFGLTVLKNLIDSTNNSFILMDDVNDWVKLINGNY